jgi:hypothetical protein
MTKKSFWKSAGALTALVSLALLGLGIVGCDNATNSDTTDPAERAAGTLGQVTGVVYDSYTFKPISGVKVVLGSKTTTTNDSGLYVFNDVIPSATDGGAGAYTGQGTNLYELSFSKNGYQSDSYPNVFVNPLELQTLGDFDQQQHYLDEQLAMFQAWIDGQVDIANAGADRDYIGGDWQYKEGDVYVNEGAEVAIHYNKETNTFEPYEFYDLKLDKYDRVYTYNQTVPLMTLDPLNASVTGTLYYFTEGQPTAPVDGVAPVHVPAGVEVEFYVAGAPGHRYSPVKTNNNGVYTLKELPLNTAGTIAVGGFEVEGKYFPPLESAFSTNTLSAGLYVDTIDTTTGGANSTTTALPKYVFAELDPATVTVEPSVVTDVYAPIELIFSKPINPLDFYVSITNIAGITDFTTVLSTDGLTATLTPANTGSKTKASWPYRPYTLTTAADRVVFGLNARAVDGSRIKDINLFVQFPTAIALKTVSIADVAIGAATYFEVAKGDVVTLEFDQDVKQATFYKGNAQALTTPLRSEIDATDATKVNVFIDAVWGANNNLNGYVSGDDEVNNVSSLISVTTIVAKGAPLVTTNLVDTVIGVNGPIVLTFNKAINPVGFAAYYGTTPGATANFDVAWNTTATATVPAYTVATLTPAATYNTGTPTKVGQLPYGLNGAATDVVTYSGLAADGTVIAATAAPDRIVTAKGLGLVSWTTVKPADTPARAAAVFRGGSIKFVFSKPISRVTDLADDGVALAYKIDGGNTLYVFVDATWTNDIEGTVYAEDDDSDTLDLIDLVGTGGITPGTIYGPAVLSSNLFDATTGVDKPILASAGIELTFDKPITLLSGFEVNSVTDWQQVWSSDTVVTLTHADGSRLADASGLDHEEIYFDAIATDGSDVSYSSTAPFPHTVSVLPAAEAYVTATNLFDAATKLPVAISPATPITITFSEAIDTDLFALDTVAITNLTGDTDWEKVWTNGNKTLTLKPTLGRLMPYNLSGTAASGGLPFVAAAKTADGANIIASLAVKTDANLKMISTVVETTTANHTPVAPSGGSAHLVQPGDKVVFTFNKPIGKNSTFSIASPVRTLKYEITGAVVKVEIDVTISAGNLTYTAISASDINDTIAAATVALTPYAYSTGISIVRSSGLYTTPTSVFGNQTTVNKPLTGGNFTLTFDRIPVGATAQVILVKQTPGTSASTPADYGTIITGTPSSDTDTLTVSYTTPTPALISGTDYVVYIQIFDGSVKIFDSDTYFTGSGTLTDGGTPAKDILAYGPTTGGAVYLSATDYNSANLTGIVIHTVP